MTAEDLISANEQSKSNSCLNVETNKMKLRYENLSKMRKCRKQKLSFLYFKEENKTSLIKFIKFRLVCLLAW